MSAPAQTLTRRLLDALRGATVLWGRRAPFDEDLVVSVTELLAVERHREYVERIPVYRRLASDQGLAESAGVEAIVGAMMFSTDVFKSYEPDWLDDGAFAELTAWLGEVSTLRPPPPGPEVTDVDGWGAHLRRHGVRLSSSSGTSGYPSFVPRDAPTWAALCGNGRHYAEDRDASPYDLLALMPSGGALGLQAAADGLARRATAAYFLEGPVTDALAFLDGAERRVLIFGPPFRAAALCEAILERGAPVALAPGSRLITGGGWKGAAPVALGDLATRALGLAVADAYSATELNAVLSMCPEGRYHAPPLLQPILLDEALDWVPDGEGEGMLAFFDPFAACYPGFLVTGDRARLTREPCPCGLSGWSIVGAITRAPGHEVRGCAGALAADGP